MSVVRCLKERYWRLPQCLVSVLLAGRFSKVHHSGECCQVLEETVLAIALVPFVACASVVSVLLAGRFRRYICEPGKA